MGCTLSMIGCELSARSFEGMKIQDVQEADKKEMMDTLGKTIEKRGHCTLFSIESFKECLREYLKKKSE